jgi:hypothetical protein
MLRGAVHYILVMKYQAFVVELPRKNKGKNAFLGKKWKIRSCTNTLLLR